MNKPFNLTEALTGKPVVNGYGQSVVDIVYYPTQAATVYKVYGLVKNSDGDEVESFTVDGKYRTAASESDLFMVQETRTGYVNVWKNDDVFGVLHATVHYSLEQAEAERTTSCSGKKKVVLVRLPFEYAIPI